jgi:hypothetical protein
MTGATGATGATGSAPPASATSPPADSGKYRLLATHVISDAVLPMGTEVGTDTPYRFPGQPTPQMMGLDDAGKAAVDKVWQDHYGMKPPWDDPTASPFDQLVADPKVLDAEAKSEPCSYQQALEKGLKEYAGKPVTGPLPPPSPTSLSGDHGVYVGIAARG